MTDTVLAPLTDAKALAVRALELRYASSASGEQRLRFNAAFDIGRDPTCAVTLEFSSVSRRHVEIAPEGRAWRVRDLSSLNGTFLDGLQIEDALVTSDATLSLGPDGPEMHLAVAGANDSERGAVTRLVSEYYAAESSEKPQDAVMREALARVVKRKRRPQAVALVLLLIALVGTLGVAFYQHMELRNVSSLARDIFYQMKTMEVALGAMERSLAESADAAALARAETQRRELEIMADRYDSLVEGGNSPSRDLTPEQQLILRVARSFGECELDIPDDFLAEVESYIEKWKSTDRLAKAVNRLHRSGYGPDIYRALNEANLPAHFLYLPLQESDFRHAAVGPETYAGFAKGVWQFIPHTATEYGLNLGPLVDEPHFDEKDERFDIDKATVAAANYLRDIYHTEAQASGLLVVASYNWGHERIRRLVRKMPDNPRERNFWQLLKHHKIPKETYDYVFYIVSAAAIGEDPRLFGFDFDSPLATVAAEAG